jgi:cyclopropane fatty-acyl-phospholipid synthase-like methyltransferase
MLGIYLGAAIDLYEVVLFMVEWFPYIIACNILAFGVVKPGYRVITLLSFPIVLLSIIAAILIGSHTEANRNGFEFGATSIREALEVYVEKGQGPAGEPLIDILEKGKYPATFGKHEMTYLMNDLISHTLLHLDSHNGENVPVAYNKGNDFFRATLGEPMVYTSGIYKKGDEKLWDAQMYKLDYVANAIDLQPTDKVLDIGCGWGRLVHQLSTKYGADVTGISLSKEQVKFGKHLNKGNDKAHILLQDAMTFEEANGSFDKITSLEMAEHVGIKRYNHFLTKVHDLLKPQGTLYFQVAGLRRGWQYEDFVWGLFMGEHVFPGADASCPMGWVTTQLERAGFEVQRVQNLGNHYSRTLDQWYDEWAAAKAPMVAKYGETTYRRWEVFLKWSVRVARQGSSTVFMITATKHGDEKARVEIQDHLSPQIDAPGSGYETQDPIKFNYPKDADPKQTTYQKGGEGDYEPWPEEPKKEPKKEL